MICSYCYHHIDFHEREGCSYMDRKNNVDVEIECMCYKFKHENINDGD